MDVMILIVNLDFFPPSSLKRRKKDKVEPNLGHFFSFSLCNEDKGEGPMNTAAIG